MSTSALRGEKAAWSYTLALVVATLVPVAAINAVGFAFSDYKEVWAAMDGPVGAHVRAALAKMRLHAFEKMWDNGFRQTTTSSTAAKAWAWRIRRTSR